MDRRTFLRRIGIAGTVAVAGCTSRAPQQGETPTTTPAEQPAVTATDFTVDRRSSGIQKDEATVSFDSETVTVDGTIWGPNGCSTAELVGARYDAGSDELAVVVGTKQEDDDGDMGCTQAIVEIDYTATVTFENGLPGRVVVTHEHGDGPVEVTTTSR